MWTLLDMLQKCATVWMSVDFTSVKKQNPWSHVKDRLLHYCLHVISSGVSFLSVIFLSLFLHSPSTRTHLLITTKMYIKWRESIIYQNAPIPPPICSHRLYRSALATTSLYLFLLCADFPFYRLQHIWGRVSKSLTRCVEECQRPVFSHSGEQLWFNLSFCPLLNIVRLF